MDVTIGYANVIWQGDATARAIQCLEHVSSPPPALNVTGRRRFPSGRSRSSSARCSAKTEDRGAGSPTAWLADASRSFELLGPVTVAPMKWLPPRPNG